MKIQDAAKYDDNPITKKTFDDAVTSGFHYCNNLAHNNNTETRFVSSGVNVLMSNSAYLSVINNALINQESGFMRFISRMVTKDEREAGVRSVNHKYDYRRNWTT